MSYNDDIVAKAEAILKAADEDGDGEFTKSELDKFLLDKVGLRVNETVLANIFTECDADNSGNVTSKELVEYIQQIKEPQLINAIGHSIKSMLFSKSFWAFLVLLNASCISWSLYAKSHRDSRIRADANFYGINGFYFTFGCLAFVFLVYDFYQAEVLLNERVIEKICLWAQSLDPSALDKDFKMNVVDLGRILERSSVFLPPATLKTVFGKIDDDGSGLLTLSEILEYAEIQQKRGKLSGIRLFRKVMALCVRDDGFWFSWMYVLGSIFFTFPPYRDELTDTAVRHYYGFGSFLFLVGALNALKNSYLGAVSQLTKMQGLQMNILALMSSGAEKGASMEDQKKSVKELFESMDVGDDGGSGDGNLEFIEVYDAFTKAGIVIELEILRSMFNQADTSGDGQISLDEFFTFIERMQVDVKGEDRLRKIFKIMLHTSGFHMAWLQVVGATFFTVTSWPKNIDASLAADLSLVGGVCYAITSIYYLYSGFMGFLRSYNSNAFAKYKFKEEFLKMVNKDPAKAQPKVAASSLSTGSFDDV